MRFLLFLILISCAASFSGASLLISSAHAETISSRPVDTKKLDALYAALKRAKSEALANDAVSSLREQWMDSGSATIDLMMQWAQEAIDRKDNVAAMDYLDQVVTLKPDFAEGWNRRATLHFMMNDYSKSMVDIQKTLELEPRHFGALSGMAMIFLSLEKKELALSAYQKALDVYPLMRDAQKMVGELTEQLAGSRT